jgi:PDZ domain-containing protein
MMISNDEKPRRKFPVAKLISWATTGLLVGGSLFVVFAPTPYLVEQPGPVYNLLGDINGDPMISISGQQTYPVSGELDMLTVTLRGNSSRGASWLDVGLAQIDSSMTVVNITDIYPEGWDDARLDEESDMMMLDSQANAKAAALKLLDIPFTSELKITRVEKSGPAGNILKAGDTVLTVQGQVATGLPQVQRMVAETQGQRTVDLEVTRDGKKLSLSVLPKQIDGKWRMGIYVQTVPTFPFPIDVQVGNVGGPSAGQILALAIYDKLTPGELTAGKRIAGTGTISQDGEIGPVGGVKQKMYGAKKAGVSWFLVPSENCDQVIGNIPDGLTVVKVSTIQDSLKAVKAIALDSGTDRLLSCKQ